MFKVRIYWLYTGQIHSGPALSLWTPRLRAGVIYSWLYTQHTEGSQLDMVHAKADHEYSVDWCIAYLELFLKLLLQNSISLNLSIPFHMTIYNYALYIN